MGKFSILVLIFLLVLFGSLVYGLSLKQEPSLTPVEKATILTKLKFSNKIEKQVLDEFDKKDKIKVAVILDDGNLKGVKRLSRKKEKINENQQKVLEKVRGKNFNLLYQYKNINALALEVDAKALEKLESLSLIKYIHYDKPMQIFLNDSIPQIEADKVWSELGYDGEGQTVCIIDTGVDYTHPAIGSASCELFPDQEDYNHDEQVSPGETKIYTILKEGYTNIAIYFKKISIVRGGYEYIEILDKTNNIIQKIESFEALGEEPPWCDVSSGFISDYWSVVVPGNTVKIKFVSTLIEDGGCGFYNITKVANISRLEGCNSFIGGYDFVNNDNDPMDDHSHGTHVSGIITSNDTKYKGVAPNASIFAVKRCNFEGSCGTQTDVANAIDYCVDMKNSYDIKIISLSLGSINTKFTSICDSEVDATAVNAAVDSGLFVSVASGNNVWADGVTSPACASKATSVGAVDKNDGFWAGSNRGSLLDLLAPGINIISTNISTSSLFTIKSGTSMAAPHVSGLAALMLQKNPALTPAQIEQIMKDTGKNITDPESRKYPRINASAAVRAVPSPETISITLMGYNTGINFGNLNPGTSNNPDQGTYTVHVDDTTNVNVDIYHKGTNFVKDSNNLAVTNMKWYNSDNIGNSFTMQAIYGTNKISNIASNTDVPMYYWLSIPAGQPAGVNYQSSITIKAVKTGNLPQ